MSPKFKPGRQTLLAALFAGVASSASAADPAKVKEAVDAAADSQGGIFTGLFSVSPGVFVYQITNTGLAAQATVSGTKFFKEDALN